MVLREEDFSAWRINWQDKARNILDLVSELRLGLDSVVFIDDNPVERARVKEALPDVFVPDWPEDKLLYRQALSALDCFDSAFISGEDRNRAQMYQAERARTMLRGSVGSLEEWLETLQTQVSIELLNNENLLRIAQLLNKTNQMNLTTRRMSSSELMTWTSAADRQLLAFRVVDRFGDSGLTGILSVEASADTLQIVDFILSCRVMGRRIEEAMLSIAAEYGRNRGLKQLCARYFPTAKNKPCLDFFERSGLTRSADDTFSWDLATNYPAPRHVKVQNEITCASTTN
jgi:FkbH-like protein